MARPGDTVSAGQVLARLESVALETLQMDMLQASNELAFADRLLAHREKLENAISGRILLETIASRQQKASPLQRRLAKASLAGTDPTTAGRGVAPAASPIRSLTVTTPIAAASSRRAHVRAGEIVEPTEHLYHIVDTSELWATAQVLESDPCWPIRPGLPVTVKLDAIPDRVFTAQIEYVGLVGRSVKAHARM